MPLNYGVRAVAHHEALTLAPRLFGPTLPARCDPGAPLGGPIDSWPRPATAIPPGARQCLVEIAAVPTFLSPFRWRVVAHLSTAYEVQEVNLLDRRFRTAPPPSEALWRLALRWPNQWTPVVARAAMAPAGQTFLGFARFPDARTFVDPDGATTVLWTDMRFVPGPTGAQTARAGARSAVRHRPHRHRQRDPAGTARAVSPRFGAHMSVAGGVPRAVDRAVVHKCEALQIFAKNANRWLGRELPAAEIEEFRAKVDAAGLRPVVSHASYLINLATPQSHPLSSIDGRDGRRNRSGRSPGLQGVVLHPGASTTVGTETAGLNQIGDALVALLGARRHGKTMVILEHTAGQGTTLGATFEQIAYLVASRPARTPACVSASTPVTCSRRATICARPKATPRRSSSSAVSSASTG